MFNSYYIYNFPFQFFCKLGQNIVVMNDPPKMMHRSTKRLTVGNKIFYLLNILTKVNINRIYSFGGRMGWEMIIKA